MVKVVTTKSVTFTTPVLDAKGKPQMTKLKYNKREIEAPLVDHQRHLAGTVIEVDKEFAADLIARKLARVPDVALDDVVDPIKQTETQAQAGPLA